MRRFAMERRGLSRRDLERFIGSRARVAEVLNHRRSLTLPMIRKLHGGLGIPAEALIRENGAKRQWLATGAARRRVAFGLA